MQNILLAAGLASRSNGEKLFLPWRGETIIQHAVRASLDAGLETIVVTGFKHEQVEALLAPFQGDTLHLAFNPAFSQGQGSSTLCGAKALMEGESFFISLADMPLIEKNHYQWLIKRFGKAEALRPSFKGNPGHPVLLKPIFKHIILQQTPMFTMKELLSSYLVKTCSVDDEAYVCDIDTLQAYNKLSRNHQNSN